MKIDAYASMPHYAAHMQPVWDALPEHVRGVWHPARDLSRRDPSTPVLVAGWRDAQAVAPAPLVYLEHGAGQTYSGDPRGVGAGSYSGGEGLDRVRVFLCPSGAVAARWRARYPHADVAVVGCPRLDRWHPAPLRPMPARPTVAVTFHWECGLVPESRSAWRFYDRALPGLAAAADWQLLGHGHPRIWHALGRRWAKLGVDHTPDLDEVLDRADVLIADNTSAMYEFASLGRPVLALNAPWYRRDVHHGLRFWSHVPGLQCDTPRDLPARLADTIADPADAQAMRAAAVAATYAHADGHAAARAAAAIMERFYDA